MKQYLKTHEWLECLDATTYRMGISKYACDQLGDIVFVEEQKASKQEFKTGKSLAILESVKAVGDIYAPCDVKLLETNPDALSTPEEINSDTWIVSISPLNKTDIDDIETMDEDEYLDYIEKL
jgi:glycine cleavage system H protein